MQILLWKALCPSVAIGSHLIPSFPNLPNQIPISRALTLIKPIKLGLSSTSDQHPSNQIPVSLSTSQSIESFLLSPYTLTNPISIQSHHRVLKHIRIHLDEPQVLLASTTLHVIRPSISLDLSESIRSNPHLGHKTWQWPTTQNPTLWSRSYQTRAYQSPSQSGRGTSLPGGRIGSLNRHREWHLGGDIPGAVRVRHDTSSVRHRHVHRTEGGISGAASWESWPIHLLRLATRKLPLLEWCRLHNTTSLLPVWFLIVTEGGLVCYLSYVVCGFPRGLSVQLCGSECYRTVVWCGWWNIVWLSDYWVLSCVVVR